MAAKHYLKRIAPVFPVIVGYFALVSLIIELPAPSLLKNVLSIAGFITFLSIAYVIKEVVNFRNWRAPALGILLISSAFAIAFIALVLNEPRLTVLFIIHATALAIVYAHNAYHGRWLKRKPTTLDIIGWPVVAILMLLALVYVNLTLMLMAFLLAVLFWILGEFIKR